MLLKHKKKNTYQLFVISRIYKNEKTETRISEAVTHEISS